MSPDLELVSQSVGGKSYYTYVTEGIKKFKLTPPVAVNTGSKTYYKHYELPSKLGGSYKVKVLAVDRPNHVPEDAVEIVIDGHVQGWILKKIPDTRSWSNLYIAERPIYDNERGPCERGETIQTVVRWSKVIPGMLLRDGGYTENPIFISNQADYTLLKSKDDKTCFGILSGRTWRAIHFDTAIPPPTPRYVGDIPIHNLTVPNDIFLRAGIEFAVPKEQCRSNSTGLNAIGVIHKDKVEQYRSNIQVYLVHAVLDIARHCKISQAGSVDISATFYETDSKRFARLSQENLIATAWHDGKSGILAMFIEGTGPVRDSKIMLIPTSLYDYTENLKNEAMDTINQVVTVLGFIAGLPAGRAPVLRGVPPTARAPVLSFSVRSAVVIPRVSQIPARGLSFATRSLPNGILAIRLPSNISKITVSQARGSSIVVRPSGKARPTIAPPKGTSVIRFDVEHEITGELMHYVDRIGPVEKEIILGSSKTP